jgi:hypothetical protein
MKRLLLLALVSLALPAFAQVNAVPGFGIRDTAGVNYENTEGQKASYFAGLGGNTPAATPTDVAILTGSATKTIKVTRVRLTVQATASGAIEYRLMKYSGGTQSAVNTAFVAATHAGAFDSSDAASTVITAGLAGVYTGNPASSGTTVGIIDDWTVTALANATMVFVYECTVPSKCITLRGTTQVLAVNGNGHTLLTAEKFGIEFNWTEE